MSKKIKHMFDYGNVKKEHKEAVEEVCKILNESNQNMISELLKAKFKIKENPKYDISLSLFLNILKNNKINYSIQGHITENNIDYPIINISEDIRRLDKIIIEILEKNKK
jgi:hypothetical protein